jgi:subtilisin family serine protease
MKRYISLSSTTTLTILILTILTALGITLFSWIIQRQESFNLQSRAQDITNPSQPHTSKFFSSDLLIKINKQMRNSIKGYNPADTGIPELNQIFQQNRVRNFQHISSESQNSQTDTELFGWYKVTLEGEPSVIEGSYNHANGNLSTKDLKGKQLQSLIAQLKQSPFIEEVEPNFQIQTSVIPNDPFYSSSGSWGQNFQDMWGLRRIHPEQAWDQTTGLSSIIVADIDTGVDRNHEDLQGNIWTNSGEIPNNGLDDDHNGYIDDYYGWNFVSNNNNPIDDQGHGTHTAGTIAATGNNALGVVGVNWTSKIMALKFLDSTGNGSDVDAAHALQYAADKGAKVSSNSWGCFCQSLLLDDAFKYEHDHGMVAVVAAGNSTLDALDFSPASSDYVLTISATDTTDSRATFSNFGPKIDVAAPGVDILSLRAAGTDIYGDASHFVPSNSSARYYRASGTSMATPHVAGLAALLLAKKPSLTNEEVRQTIRQGADDVGQQGKDPDYGFGIINTTSTLNRSTTTVLAPFISSPRSRTGFSSASNVQIMGGVPGPNFARYKVELGNSRSPNQWTLLTNSTTQVTNGILATANFSNLSGAYYTIRLTATDTSGKDYQFQVFDIKSNIDYSPPTITVSNPANNSVLPATGSIRISASAKDASRVDYISIYFDNRLIISCGGGSSCTIRNFNVTGLAPGNHVITVESRDLAPLPNIGYVYVNVIKR